MSRIRVANNGGPNDWREEEPREARLSTQGHIVRGAAIESVRPRHKFGDGPARPGNNPAREPEHKPLCGVLMALSGVPCARRSGHRDNHSTPEAVEKNRLRRRRYYVANFGGTVLTSGIQCAVFGYNDGYRVQRVSANNTNAPAVGCTPIVGAFVIRSTDG